MTSETRKRHAVIHHNMLYTSAVLHDRVNGVFSHSGKPQALLQSYSAF